MVDCKPGVFILELAFLLL